MQLINQWSAISLQLQWQRAKARKILERSIESFLMSSPNRLSSDIRRYPDDLNLIRQISDYSLHEDYLHGNRRLMSVIPSSFTYHGKNIVNECANYSDGQLVTTVQRDSTTLTNIIIEPLERRARLQEAVQPSSNRIRFKFFLHIIEATLDIREFSGVKKVSSLSNDAFQVHLSCKEFSSASSR